MNGHSKNLNYMDKQLNNTLASVNVIYDKSRKKEPEKQISEPFYKDIANIDAVKTEIGDVIEVFNDIIKSSRQEVDLRKSAKEVKYSQRGFYSQDLNATIKEKLIIRINSDPDFAKKIRIRKNYGSVYFIIKDRYILYVKRLYGKQNKPNSYPTPNSNKLFEGTLFPSYDEHTPVLFIGPNLSDIETTDAFVTSLISRNEINWSLKSSNLFTEAEVRELTSISTDEQPEKEIVKLKKGLESPSKKQQSN